MHSQCTHSAHDGLTAHALTLDWVGEDIRDVAADATAVAAIGPYIWAHDPMFAHQTQAFEASRPHLRERLRCGVSGQDFGYEVEYEHAQNAANAATQYNPNIIFEFVTDGQDGWLFADTNGDHRLDTGHLLLGRPTV